MLGVLPFVEEPDLAGPGGPLFLPPWPLRIPSSENLLLATNMNCDTVTNFVTDLDFCKIQICSDFLFCYMLICWKSVLSSATESFKSSNSEAGRIDTKKTWPVNTEVVKNEDNSATFETIWVFLEEHSCTKSKDGCTQFCFLLKFLLQTSFCPQTVWKFLIYFLSSFSFEVLV